MSLIIDILQNRAYAKYCFVKRLKVSESTQIIADCQVLYKYREIKPKNEKKYR
jgi:hypothetical protein